MRRATFENEIDYTEVSPLEYYRDPKYYFEILQDKSWDNWKWNIDNVRRNQRLDPAIEIVRKHLCGQDKDNEYKNLSKREIGDLRKGRYVFNKDNGLVYYITEKGKRVI